MVKNGWNDLKFAMANFIMLSKFNGHNYAEFYPFVCIMLCSSVNKKKIKKISLPHVGLQHVFRFFLKISKKFGFGDIFKK